MTTEQPEHDPTGLDLASEIARATVEASPYLPPPPAGASPPAPRRRRPRVFDEERSGSHPDDRDPQAIGSVLDAVVARRGGKRRISLSMVLRDWEGLVGDANAEHSRPTDFTDGILTIQCDSTAWATAMRYNASPLVQRLNDRLGEQTVTRVKILAPQQQDWRKGSKGVRDGRGPRDTYG